MYLDVFTLSGLVDEFMDTLVGGRIQDVLDVDETGLGLEVYAHQKRHYLYLSADTNAPRLYITPEKLRRGTEKATTLWLLFRRYVEGGKIVHVSQPEWERVVHLHLETVDGEMELILEPMERRSNILLVQNGTILDCMRRVGADENRVRVSLPNHPYVPPPKQAGKRNPFTITEADIADFLSQTIDPKTRTYQVLTANMLGMSPLLAREIVYRACEDTKQKASSANA
ncbi:MAG TPA: NFACT family protein, partial [Aggregatilineales bacterium]|nr:NFACT family protein [Aggregatilineales bacterium]